MGRVLGRECGKPHCIPRPARAKYKVAVLPYGLVRGAGLRREPLGGGGDVFLAAGLATRSGVPHTAGPPAHGARSQAAAFVPGSPSRSCPVRLSAPCSRRGVARP